MTKQLLPGVLVSCLCLGWGLSVVTADAAPPPRQVVSLDGSWEIAEGAMDKMPTAFDHHVPVPGLVDLAKPAFVEVGNEKSLPHRQAFWYRRSFTLSESTMVQELTPDSPPYLPSGTSAQHPARQAGSTWVRLKINKAMYGTRVFVNGKLAGDHLPCFTPAEFDITQFLAPPGQPNELVIRIGAVRSALPKGMPDGYDPEKPNDDRDYVPGIYDSVELTVGGWPRIVNVQTVPDIERKSVRVVAEINGLVPDTRLTCHVREAATGEEVGTAESSRPSTLGQGTVDVTVPIKDCHLWSPEDPFLYELEVSTGADSFKTRFGMRSFRLDRKTGHAVLNGKPYFLRGNSLCIYRFFADPKRGDLPWSEDWVRKLHRSFKHMNWNSIRYCIGFPPEMWYRIADEEGLLIDDEFPFWYMNGWPKEMTSDILVPQFTEWMRERWNHPCVAIWDAQNETVADASGVAKSALTETGKAIQAVRHLDLSNRPWDNGWDPPVAPTDSYEAHPYLFGYRGSRFSDFAWLSGAPGSPEGFQVAELLNTGKNPVIIDEYSWGHIRRDGQLSDPGMQRFYDELTRPPKTPDERRELHARLMAAETEFWRAKRQVAGVLIFCGLGYSKPGAPTSDNFTDIEKLTLDPYFEKYVRDSFAPVGVMLDFWDEQMAAGTTQWVQVVVVNDRNQDWNGTVRLMFRRGQTDLLAQERIRRVKGLGTNASMFAISAPSETGQYQLVAQLSRPGQPVVESVRDVAVVPESQMIVEVSRGKKATASSSATVAGVPRPASNAVDGKAWTRWTADASDPQWITIDLEKPTKFSRVQLVWEGINCPCYAKKYSIQVSNDGTNWKDVFHTDTGKGGIETVNFAPVEARYVRMLATERSTKDTGCVLFEFRVFR